MSLLNAKVDSTEPLDPSTAKWTRLNLVHYTDPNKKQRSWEYASRSTRPKNSDIDGVGIVAILKGPKHPSNTADTADTEEPRILLQKQFRPPINKVCIEVPAGLVDEGETGAQAAVRELKEETGFVGTVDEETPVMFNDPGFCNTNLTMVHVNVDLEKEENRRPKPELEENEYIECFTVELTRLYKECRKLEKEGHAIDARVGTLAEGIEIARQWGVR
ncbi:hypothetical protein EV356DRAFT_503620 [Viridothelium virens]|uniref:Nudix hydrolase domain-containing protein n=1 Tax=Viridothelium virens TaxID=1048519 RepID=A0A6A6H6R1_VIRVR|nr:hypothetical protein EV356DRAFT_503620 [Viridothelium virens]